MPHRKLRNIHPGEVLIEDFLKPLGISQSALAGAIGVPPQRLNAIALGKRSITADTAVRLARALGTSKAFWLGLQADYELEHARSELAVDCRRSNCSRRYESSWESERPGSSLLRPTDVLTCSPASVR